MFVFEGLIIGLLGSLHCMGMCGPMALALPLGNKTGWRKVVSSLLYNIGRAGTYSLMGLVLGLLGAGAKIAGIQQWVSIVCGIIIILSVMPFRFLNLKKLFSDIFYKNNHFIQKGISKRMRNQKLSTLFIIGLLNGLLPCGLVYIAISGALATDSIAKSVGFMFLFGLGTLPMLFVISYFGSLIKGRILPRIQKALPVFVVILGLLFIIRGLNLGIPYLSPKFNETKQEMNCCH